MATTKAHYQVRALERALHILDSFTLDQPELSLSALAVNADLAPSTALRLLAILAEYGYVEKSPETDKYRLGVAVFERGSVYIQTTRIEGIAQQPLAALARDSNQTASLAVLDHGEIIHIAVVPAGRAIRYYTSVGQREMAHCTGLGKALLAGLDDVALEEVVNQRGLPGRTDRTITNVAALRAHLAEIRERGYAIDNEESIVGLRCVAAPVIDDRGRVVAAVSASGPAAEFDDATVPALIRMVRATAGVISDQLGHRVQTGTDRAPDGQAAAG